MTMNFDSDAASDGRVRGAMLHAFDLRENWEERHAVMTSVWPSDYFGVTANLSALTPTGRPVP
jgi:hypothetical protein